MLPGLLLPAGKIYSQNTIEILDEYTQKRSVNIKVGEILTVEIWVDFIDVNVRAVYAYFTFDGNVFEVLDANTGKDGIQPFNLGGAVWTNDQANLYENGNGIPYEQISLEVDWGTGGSPITGRNFIGRFRLKAIDRADNSKIFIDYDPGNARHTRYNTVDGISKAFGRGPRLSPSDEGLAMTVNVTGIGLEDIPNVYFQPGETNDKINLDHYVINPTASLDNLQWQYSGNTNVLVSVSQDSPRNVVLSHL